jgi:uncharacterized protein (DUF58 family)
VDNRIYVQLADLVALQHEARGFSFLPRQPLKSVLSGRHTSRLRGRGLNFEELRHYRTGDDIRSLDWKVTHRTGKPHVRVYTEERERSVILLVDQRRAMFFGTREKMKSVVAAELAALTAWRTLAVGDRVGAVVFNDESIYEIKPQRSRHTVLRILRKVLEFNHALGSDLRLGHSEGQLDVALSAVARVVGHDNLVALVSDLNGWDDGTIKAITRIARHNDVISSLIYDPMESELPSAQCWVVSDGAMQIQIKSGARLRTDFSEEFDSRVQYLQHELNKHKVPVLPIDTVESVPKQLRRMIGDGGLSR